MARNRPPQHRADTPGIWIARTDSSFDRDRFDRELLELAAQDLDPATHPVSRYYAGDTRFDLQAADRLFDQAVTAGAYFDASKEPERFILRRLDWEQWHRVMSLVEQGAFTAGQLLAARYGVAEVQNSPLKLTGATAGLLTHEDMQRLFEADPALPSALGLACWRYSRALTDPEKKA
jgi:hypothetical protein